MEHVKRNWINTAGIIDDVADPCHPARTVRKILGESWDPDQVHFLVTAEEPEGEEDLAAAAESGNIVSELPLQTLNRSKAKL